MADFLVLEEDGTSHLELEESTDDLLLESLPPPPPPPPPAVWEVGTLTTTGSPGDVSVTLSDQPVAVFFFGTNFLTEDTAITTNYTGIFRGMACPKYDDPGTLLQNAECVLPASNGFLELNHAILILNTANTGAYLYRADVTFDVSGFTASFLDDTEAGHKIVYVALMQANEIGAYVGQDTTLSLGWKAGAMMMHGAWGGPVSGNLGQAQAFYGSAAYPGTGGGSSWFSAGLTAFAFQASSYQQYITGLNNGAPEVLIAQDGEFLGPYLSPQNVIAIPSGGSLTDFLFDTNASDTGGMLVLWDDEENQTGRTAPGADTDDTATVTGLPFSPGLLITYTISNEPDGLGSSDPYGARGATGFSVVTSEGFQWCATVDGVNGRGSFMSFQRGFADTVDGTAVHAGTVELTADGFILTTEEDTTTTHDLVWHAFGRPPQNVMWIPRIYRRMA